MYVSIFHVGHSKYLDFTRSAFTKQHFCTWNIHNVQDIKQTIADKKTSPWEIILISFESNSLFLLSIHRKYRLTEVMTDWKLERGQKRGRKTKTAHLRGIFSSLMAATVSFTSCLVKKLPSRSGCKKNHVSVRHPKHMRLSINAGNGLLCVPHVYTIFDTHVPNCHTKSLYITRVCACLCWGFYEHCLWWAQTPSLLSCSRCLCLHVCTLVCTQFLTNRFSP